jgi:hypothetical protein
MARFNVPQFSTQPYYITAKRIRNDDFPIPSELLWKVFETELMLAHYKYGLKIHCFVLLPKRFHLLASIERIPIGTILNLLMKNVTTAVNAYSQRINHNWADGHNKCILITPQHFKNCYKFVYQSPVREGLCSFSEEWKYSTLFGILGYDRLTIPLERDHLLFSPELSLETLSWISQKIHENHLHDFQVGLAKRIFKLPKRRSYAPRNELEFLDI